MLYYWLYPSGASWIMWESGLGITSKYVEVSGILVLSGGIAPPDPLAW